eukprot:jgi/Ulvmu1/10833/UM007_0007.1
MSCTACAGRNNLLRPALNCRIRRGGNSQRPAVPCRAVEQLQGVRQEVLDAIDASLDRCLTETQLRDIGEVTVGKVRDTYEDGEHLIIVTTDRQSAFDRILASIPFKGQVLNQVSLWWFQRTAALVPNAVVATPDPCVTVMRKCEVFPVEFVVRGFMTGSTDTSLWTHYSNGERQYCGNHFPGGMVKNQRLAENVITPTTKSATHDVPISAAEIVEQGLMSQEDWEAASSAALRLFAFGQETAASRGLLLVDTKYEFGRDADGNVLLIDEVHTPDSSRYWLADTYEERFAAGQEPQNIDKEFLRLWFRQNCDPYGDENLPEAPSSLVAELSKRYIYLFERITGTKFQLPPLDEDPSHRLAKNVREWSQAGKQ